MSISTDSSYLSEISIYLPLFKWQRSGQVASCRCILCGDSKKDSTKTRGFFYPDDDNTSLQYKCHNCGQSMKFSWFLKTQFPETYREYVLAKFRERTSKKTKSANPIVEKKEPPKAPTGPLKWTFVADLPDDHDAKVYCIGRGLQEPHMKRIVYADCFQKWSIDNLVEIEQYPPKGPRIIFPFVDLDGNLFGAQGRVFVDSNKNDRFKIAMKKGCKRGKVFGLDIVNKTLPVIIVEGVIDSIFLPNCIALCGGDVTNEFIDISKNVIVALDNEPRSEDTVNRMIKAIDMGYRVVLWPVATTLKDINNMINSGMTVKDILRIIAKNSFSGAVAKLKLTYWKKV